MGEHIKAIYIGQCHWEKRPMIGVRGTMATMARGHQPQQSTVVVDVVAANPNDLS